MRRAPRRAAAPRGSPAARRGRRARRPRRAAGRPPRSRRARRAARSASRARASRAVAQRCEFALRSARHALEVRRGSRRARGCSGGAGEAVERVALGGRGAQPQLVGLAVHDDEFVAEFGEHAGGGAAAADRRRGCGPRSRPSGRAAARAPVADGSSSPPASRDALGDRAVARARASGPRPTPAPRRSARRRSRRAAPSSSPSAVTTIVLPAPVSPVIAVKPGPSGSVASAITPRSRMRDLLDHGLSRGLASRPHGPSPSRRPGSWNLCTRRSVNGASDAAGRAAPAPADARTIDARAGRQVVRAAAVAPEDRRCRRCARASRRRATSSGPTTSGRANSACALSGTSSDRLDGSARRPARRRRSSRRSSRWAST